MVDELKPLRLLSASKSLDGPLHQNLEAFKVHKMWWTNSRPPANLFYVIDRVTTNFRSVVEHFKAKESKNLPPFDFCSVTGQKYVLNINNGTLKLELY